MARPFKVLIPEQKEQFGVVARSLRLLRDGIQKRYGLKSDFKIFLTDGTAVDDEEYFAFLEPQTLLIVKHAVSNSSSDTKTSVVDLTCNEVPVLVCNGEKCYESQSKTISNSTDSSTQIKNAETQGVLSIRIAKVQGNVKWETGGASFPVDTPHERQRVVIQSDAQVVSNSAVPQLRPYHTSQTINTCSAVPSRVPSQAMQQQQPNLDAVLRELYHQTEPTQHYPHLKLLQSQPIRPSQRYLMQHQQMGRNGLARNAYYHILRHSSSSGHGGISQQERLSSLPPH